MRFVIYILVFLLFSACQQGPNGELAFQNPLTEPEFVPGTEDVPLHLGFTASADTPIVFDTGTGRILDAHFTSHRASPEKVSNFYQATLPQLGWQLIEDHKYQREGESLNLNIKKESNHTILHISLKPIS